MSSGGMKSLLLLLLALRSLVPTIATYYKVAGEKDPLLQNSTKLFEDFLFPSAKWKAEDFDQECLDNDQIQEQLTTVPDWTYSIDQSTGAPCITREFTFEDFRNAFLFMSQSAQLAEKNQHHPSWSNLYNTVSVLLSTDDVPCLGTFDLEFAQGMDMLYANF